MAKQYRVGWSETVYNETIIDRPEDIAAIEKWLEEHPGYTPLAAIQALMYDGELMFWDYDYDTVDSDLFQLDIATTEGEEEPEAEYTLPF